jgi:hypothetical protein
MSEFYFEDDDLARAFWAALLTAELALQELLTGAEVPEPLPLPERMQKALDEALAKLDFPIAPTPEDKL